MTHLSEETTTMDGKSLDITQERINKLKEILPDAFTEGKIDWEKLQASAGMNIEFKNERYVLNWAGKSDAFRLLQSPTTATYETSELIEKAIKAVNQMPIIKKASIKTTKTALQFNDFGIIADPKSSYTTSLDGFFKIPDVLFYIQERTELTRSTILEILKGSGRLGDMLINPQLFLDSAVVVIKDVLYELMIEGIKYEKIGTKEYEMRLFEDYEIHINDLTFKVSRQDKTIYSNLIPLDSNVEYDFAKECESRDDIEFYFKLPFWFKIKTPIGNYNPDWALIKKNEKTVYFVAETKSAGQELKTSEQRKIKCGQAHFDEFDDVEFKQVATVGELN